MADQSTEKATPEKKEQKPQIVFNEKGKTDQEKATCPRCGWHPTDKPAAPDADMQEYLRCALGGKLFTKVYPLYDGKLKLKFRSVNAAEAEFINKVLMKNDFDSDIEVQDMALKAKLLFYLVSVETPEGEEVFEAFSLEEFTVTAVNEEYKKRFGTKDETLLRSINQTFQIFLGLQQLLIAGGFDSNFWKGAGPF